MHAKRWITMGVETPGPYPSLGWKPGQSGSCSADHSWICEQHFYCSAHLLGYSVIQRPTVFQEFQESPTAKKVSCFFLALQRSALQIPRHPATMGNSPFVQPLPRSLALMEMQCETLNWMCLVLRCVYSRYSISLEIGPTRCSQSAICFQGQRHGISALPGKEAAQQDKQRWWLVQCLLHARLVGHCHPAQWFPLHLQGNRIGALEPGGNGWQRPDHVLNRFGYGSIPINTIFRGMNIHLPAILMFTRGTRFWHTAIWSWNIMDSAG